MDPPRLQVSTDASWLDVDDPARVQLDRVSGGLQRVDRLVQADGSAHDLGHLRVRQHLILRHRLLDEQQLVRVQLGEVLGVREPVGGVGVDLQRHVAETLAHRAHRLEVPAGLDLQLDAPVALVEKVAHRAQQIGDGAMNANRDAAVDLGAHSAEVLAERFATRVQLSVEDRHLDGRLRHLVAVHVAQQAKYFFCFQLLAFDQAGQQVMSQHVLRAVDVLRRVGGLLTRDALAPSLAVGGDRLHQQDVAV